jgi:hypothetical protein
MENMENSNNNSYIKADNNIIINEAAIRWAQKMDECISVCTKSIGCYPDDALKICKISNHDSYMKLNKHFE